MSECDANVFVALYEAILGEKVPGNLFMLLQPYRNMSDMCLILCFFTATIRMDRFQVLVVHYVMLCTFIMYSSSLFFSIPTVMKLYKIQWEEKLTTVKITAF